MDGWTPVGSTAICALCGAELGAMADVGGHPVKDDGDGASAGRARAAAVLGVAEDEGDGKAHGFAHDTALFCKDCRHFYKHPFYARCLLHEKEIDPMGDCPDFDPGDEGREKDGSNNVSPHQ